MRTLLSDIVHVRNNCSSIKSRSAELNFSPKTAAKPTWNGLKCTEVKYLFIFRFCQRLLADNKREFLFIKSSSLILQSVLPKNCSFKAVWNLQFSGWIKHLGVFFTIAVVEKTVFLGHFSQLPRQCNILFLKICRWYDPILPVKFLLCYHCAHNLRCLLLMRKPHYLSYYKNIIKINFFTVFKRLIGLTDIKQSILGQISFFEKKIVRFGAKIPKIFP